MDSRTIVKSFKGKRILVIGDVMIDAYLQGKVSRVSPEAPVPIVSFGKHEERLGGAANVALNIAALGAVPVLTSVIGEDKEGERLLELMHLQEMSVAGIVRSTDRITTVKTRVIGNNQHLLRIDHEQTNPVNSDEETELIERVKAICESGIDAIIFEDYNKGTLTERVIQEVIALATLLSIPTAVDPKKDNFFAYQGVTLFKPNLKELKEGLNIDFQFRPGQEFEDAVNELEKRLNNTITFVTLSEHGVFIKHDEKKHYIQAHLRNIADVSGAGDTVISVATLCYTVGVPVELIASFANLAGGIVCEKVGVVSIDKEELIREADKLIKV